MNNVFVAKKSGSFHDRSVWVEDKVPGSGDSIDVGIHGVEIDNPRGVRRFLQRWFPNVFRVVIGNLYFTPPGHLIIGQATVHIAGNVTNGVAGAEE